MLVLEAVLFIQEPHIMSKIQGVFKTYAVNNPLLWLAEERKKGRPSETGIWSELIESFGHEWSLGGSVRRTLSKCAIPFDKSIVPENTHSATLLNLLRDDVSVFLPYHECRCAIVCSADLSALRGLYLDTGGGGNNPDVLDICFAGCYAILTSWEQNSDPEKANIAGRFLCDRVEELLK